MITRTFAVSIGAVFGFSGAAHAFKINDQFEIYGHVFPQIESQNASTGTVANGALTQTRPVGSADNFVNTTKVQSTGSWVGFQANKTIGGVKATLVGEVTAKFEDTTNTNSLGSRNFYVGLEGGFGDLKLGRFDTLYWEWGDQIRMLGVSSANFVSTANIESKAPFGGGLASSFTQRPRNGLKYISPAFGDFKVGLNYHLDNGQTSAKNATIAGAGIRWQKGPWSAALATETHTDFLAFSNGRTSATTTTGSLASLVNVNATTHSRDTATRLSLAYKTREWRLGGDISTTKYTENGAATRFGSYQRTAWNIAGDYKLTDKVTLAANYQRAGRGSASTGNGTAISTDGMEGSNVSLGLAYDLDKDIRFFAIAARLDNGNNAIYANNVKNTRTGQTLTQAALGVLYKF